MIVGLASRGVGGNEAREDANGVKTGSQKVLLGSLACGDGLNEFVFRHTLCDLRLSACPYSFTAPSQFLA